MDLNQQQNTQNVLEVVNLIKKYDSFTLDKVNFSIQRGKITGFIGINGAGKTTTIKSLAGLLIPNEGEMRFWGEVINRKNESRIRDRLGFLLDGNYYYPELTIKQMKNIFRHAYTNWDEKVFKELVEKFDLPLKQKISKLSKGMTMKFSLALALSHHAEILIMDEPTSGLDPLVRSEFIDMLKELAQQGVSILFSSHITSDLEKIADDIIFIHKGHILLQKEIDDLLSSHFVVKDKLDLLNPENKKLFLKVSENKGFFEGIYNGNKEFIIEKFPEANIAPANIEEIMLGHIFSYIG